MATVVITFFLLTRLYVCKMDAECIDRRRSAQISRREQRWSMNSQRLDEIVAELMKPISDVRRSFDTDLSALLEEYLTEAGLHALEAGEEEGAGVGAPNFAELALLLQHSASVYGRKVDFLYQHVLSVSDSLHNSTLELERQAESVGGEAETSGGGGTRRRRRSGAEAGFGWVELASVGGAARECGAPRPPPTLPRAYIELEPRQLGDADRPLTDYDCEPVGLLADFHVSWRLQDGMLVDELEANAGTETRSLRPIPLMELQAAIAANAPPPPPPAPLRDTPPRDPCPSPLHASTPLPPPAPSPPPTPPVKEIKERKRRNEANIDDILGGCFKLLISKEVRQKLRKMEEFSVSPRWIDGVVAPRRAHILRLRRLCRRAARLDFRGFEDTESDIGGFMGWSISVATEAQKIAETTAAAAAPEGDSDDDGFFEQSSLGDSDASRNDESTLPTTTLQTLDNSSAWSSWQASVVARATAGEARGLDVRQLATRLLEHVPSPGQVPCTQLLRHAARQQHDVPGLFLATLFLANAGNLEIVQGAPLTLNSFSVRLRSADPRLYDAAARDDPHFLR